MQRLLIVIGAVLDGCVQDFVILDYSLRRDGRLLGKMARNEMGPVGSFTATASTTATADSIESVLRRPSRRLPKPGADLGFIVGSRESALVLPTRPGPNVRAKVRRRRVA